MVILDARDVRKSFGWRAVLRGASLTVREGETVAVVGDNGSGKSTLLQVLSGVLAVDRGAVTVAGTIGFSPERPDLPDHLVVAEWLDVVASLKGLRGRPEPLFGVDALAGVKVGALSLGQRQRVSLAAAFLGAPSLLLLDEPTNAIDADTREALAARLGNRTAVIATHDRAFAERVATRSVVMERGVLEG
jgi:ABC-type multidrug transport system ATPase subunit